MATIAFMAVPSDSPKTACGRKIFHAKRPAVGDVVEEADGDLMGDGVNIAARLEGVGRPGTICLSEDAYRQVKSRTRSEGERSWTHFAQEHRRAGARLFRRDRQAR